jgi:hypothetical protein
MGTTFDFFITIEINNNTLRLDGNTIAGAVTDVKNAVTNGFHVSYKADSFDDAFSLGTLASAQAALDNLITSTLGGDATAKVDIQGSVNSMVTGTPLASVITKLEQDAELRITDLAFTINTTTTPKTFTFTLGLGIDLGDSFTLGPPYNLGLRSFGFVVTHS